MSGHVTDADLCDPMTTSPTPAIVFCITDLDTGGAERSLVELVTHLSPQRFRPIVVSLAPPPTPPNEALVGELTAAGVHVEFLGGRSALQAPAIIGKLTRLLKEWQPRIVQTFLFHANVVGAIAARRAAVQYVVTGIRVAERRANLHHWLARRTARLVDCHVCVSESVADFSREVAGLPAEKLVVIPTGVDLKRFPAPTATRLTDLGIAPGRRGILSAARLDPQKRLEWLLERAATFLPQLPEHDLVIAGRGPNERQLKRLAIRLGIDQRVHFVGWRTDLPQVIAASDLLVLTSRWEGFPRVVLEAMASGKPVVTTAVEGVGEVLGPLAHDQLLAADDAAGFAQAVVAVAAAADYGAQLGRHNRQRVADHFTIDRTVAAYEALYEAILMRNM